MNKYAIFAVLALTCLSCRAQTDDIDEDEEYAQAAIRTSDDDETSLLGINNQVFEQFCIDSRDNFFANVKANSNKLSSRLFSTLFEQASEVATRATNVAKMGSEKLSRQLANPDTKIEDAQNEADQVIADGQAKIQEVRQPKAIFEAFKSAIRATAGEFRNLASKKLRNLVELLSVDNAYSSMENICSFIHEEKKNIETQFDSAKDGLVREDPSFKSVTVKQVPCITSRRVLNLSDMCNLFQAAKGPIQSIWATRTQSRLSLPSSV